jgi:hypothetical protein
MSLSGINKNLFVGGKAAYFTNYFKISKTIRIGQFLEDI